MTINNMNAMEHLLRTLRIQLAEQFNQNFRRKAFFDRPWRARRINTRGSLLTVSGHLRRSIRSSNTRRSITFTSSAPHAALHNDGGTITVTARMRRFFWAKYYTLAPKIRYRRDGKASARSQTLSVEAEMYRNLALMPIGSKITIPKRQFIGDHPQVRRTIDRTLSQHLSQTLSRLASKHR